MNRTFLAVCGAVVMSAGLVAAQDKSPSGSNSNSATADTAVTFTGCLNTGSTKDTFYLTNAKHKGPKTTDKSLKIVPGDGKVSLSRFVTQEVEVTGTVDKADAPADAKDGAQQVRTLTVTKVKQRGDSCS